MRLEYFGHLGDRQPFGERNRDRVHFSARDLPEHVPSRHRAIETIFARLQPTRLAARPERETIRDLIANDSFREQGVADRSRACARGDIDELLAPLVSTERFIEPLEGEVARGASGNQEDEEQEYELLHGLFSRHEAHENHEGLRGLSFSCLREQAIRLATPTVIKIVLQENRSSGRIQDFLPFAPITFVHRKTAFRFPAGQPLIRHSNGNGGSSSKGRDECRHMCGLVAWRAVQTNRHANHDFRDPVFVSRELCNFVRHPVNGVVWIDRESRKRAGQRPGGIANRQAHTPLPDVDRQNTHDPDAIIPGPGSGLPAPGFRLQASTGSCQSPKPQARSADTTYSHGTPRKGLFGCGGSRGVLRSQRAAARSF